MLKSDVENAEELAELLFDLTQEEGNAVEIFHPNAYFNGANCIIGVTTNWAFDQPINYTGESVIDCLRKAKEARLTTNTKEAF